LQSQKGVIGIVVVNADGAPIRSTLPDNSLTNQYAALFSQLLLNARNSIKEIDTTVTFKFPVVADVY
jgi:dynein light chain roadblock-type